MSNLTSFTTKETDLPLYVSKPKNYVFSETTPFENVG